MFISRCAENEMVEFLQNKTKIVLVYGPRQAGKTTLVKRVGDALGLRYLYITADLVDVEKLLAERNLQTFRTLTNGYQLLIIDEAQRVPEIGTVLKIFYDLMPDIKVIATGSSSFDLANKTAEQLTGRKRVFFLLPFSLSEIKGSMNSYELGNQLEDLMIYGMYPEVYLSGNIKDKKQVLSDIRDSYLFKDILMLTNVKFTSKIRDLVHLLAFQTGMEVSIHELSNTLKINQETVERYIELLEKSFVIFRLSGFNRNLRKEIGKRDKIYFYDTGIRNSLIDNYNPLSARNDVGQLWENFIVAERRKQLHNNGKEASTYFWRTYTGAEIDYVEEIETKLCGYEIKFGNASAKIPATWKQEYNGYFQVINQTNYIDWLLEKLE